MPKHDFLLSYELESVFDSFTDEQAGRLIKAVFDYEKRKELPVFGDQLLQMMFDTVIKQKSDENTKAYKLRCEQQRENAKRRWKGRGKMPTHATACNGMPNMPSDAMGYNGMPNMPTHAMDADIDIDNDNDKSLSISTECQSETEKIVRDFSQVIGKRKISVKKRFELMSKYKEMRAEKPKEEVDQALLDYLAQE